MTGSGPQFPRQPEQPFAGQPYPGQYPQGQQYPQGWPPAPPSPPSPPKRSKLPWLIGGALGVVVLVVLAVALVNSTKAQPEQPVSAGPAADAPASSAAPKKIAGAPVLCPNSTRLRCMPGMTNVAQQLEPQLQARGFSCHVPTSADNEPVGNLHCETALTSANQRQMSVDFEAPDLRTSNPALSDFHVYGDAAEWGVSTDLSADAWSQEKQLFDALLGMVFPQNAQQLRGDLDGWVNGHVQDCGTRTPSSATIPTQNLDGYTITCTNPSPISVSGSKGTYTSFTGGIDVQVDQFAP